jgi:aminoglycoside phosphotransferase (APT) family kinase protein
VPLLEERDPVAAGAALRAWLRFRLPPDAEPDVEAVTAPAGSGFSGETLLVSASWAEAGERRPRELVVRTVHGRFRVAREVDLATQVRVMRLLRRHSTLPVPAPLWYEEDGATLGGPFAVMEKLPGRSPTDQPPYHQAGWLADAEPAERSAIWWAGVDAVARLHAVDVTGPDWAFLRGPAETSLRRHLDHLDAQQAWSRDATDIGEIRAAQRWLRAHQPPEPDEPVLLWGDARIGNMLFGAGGTLTGALDWEKATTGPREIDLAWFLYVDRHHSEGCRLPRLAGLPGPAETVARYQRLVGREVRDMPYFQLLSAYHFALLMGRAVALLVEFDLMPEEVASDYVTSNSSTALLRACLAEVA